MAEDYSNAHNLKNEGKKKDKDKDKPQKEKPEIKRITQGEVVVHKKSVGKKFKEMIIEADFQSTGRHLMMNVLIPAVKATIVSLGTQGIERMVFGDNAARGSRWRNPAPRTTYYSYNQPVQRQSYPPDPSGPIGRSAPSISGGPRTPRNIREDFICVNKEDADRVLDQMNDIIDSYGVVTVQDVCKMIGWEFEYTDNNWGWDSLADVAIRQVREGFLLDLPPAQHIT